ncbi:hypothetical protein N4T77_02750 [Clostridium sp. CX1]|uniref:hypothetical protein n=1 Tax=Clostridium sp. CX1 TaxID=2978346 RepID=UPI0021C0F0E6|nr:hypothetical protein [Clostridium sp. CX1]MCT8975510.1 hypothetical protein [Clostridium sp. CX1]
MNKETLKELEQGKDLRTRGIEALAFALDIDYEEAEELIDEMNRQLENPSLVQIEYEKTMQAEFSY